MSRHILIDQPNLQVVLGFDHMLRAFFGQVFDPSHPRREGIAIDGWPTKSGLGMRRPVVSRAHAAEDLSALTDWVGTRIPGASASEPRTAFRLGYLMGLLHCEWAYGEDVETLPVPDALRAGR